MFVCVCKLLDKAMGFSSRAVPGIEHIVPQFLNLMRGEKVNVEQRVITGSLRLVDVRVS